MLAPSKLRMDHRHENPSLSSFTRPVIQYCCACGCWLYAQSVNTVSAAQAASDDTPVVLQGHIVQRLKDHERYTFKDATGTITVEIDDEDLPLVPFNEKTLVKLIGEVDRGLMSREIDVDRVEIIN